MNEPLREAVVLTLSSCSANVQLRKALHFQALGYGRTVDGPATG